MNEAYLKTCKKIDVSLHGHNKNVILSNYEEDFIIKETVDKLEKNGINLDDIGYKNDDGSISIYDAEDVVELVFRFIKLSLSDFEYYITNDEVPTIIIGDGFIGYGIYH